MASRNDRWLQLNVALARHNGTALPAARHVLRAIEELPASARAGFFFQRKPPDLRLRFAGDRERLSVRLLPLLRRARSEGHVLRYFSSVYEPEYRQFGGPECMRAVHKFWNTDSLMWIRSDRLAENGFADRERGPFIEAVLEDLFWRAMEDPCEVWDAWCNFGVLVRASLPGSMTTCPPRICDLQAAALPHEADLAARYQQANAALADGLSRARENGRMSCGIRSIMPFIALFTLNRHGYDQPRLTALAGVMAAAWNPKQQLTGAAPAPARRELPPVTATTPQHTAPG
ncbi:hypothetical protein CVM73_32110 [Bradyrhizobium forestalis]|uniref:Thiopeptide-type bacteriocin biosynthesis domain-containing protein n=1 Tax=Bradyrhizobium forestalis TaxID=1419263 RepID=A0A2M8R0B5_9BRAD|nr:thiopeptide-type bacteriocin biosynthesis protein [Bradyrhizobium forestalis]PJG51262.1 hypothetical protein CVM73_32110 [Bradyrhizobium forestalis]